jgi:UDP-N-acetylmuramoyl-L-alanyl-D-glutamate--2,6-diaminopimelate ligase
MTHIDLQHPDLLWVNAKNLQWKIQDVQDHDLLFLHLTKNVLGYLKELKARPCAIVCSGDKAFLSNLKLECPIVFVSEEDMHKYQKKCCDVLYPMPEKLKFFGVTGTNGKTSTVHFMMQLCVQQHISNLAVGTLGVYVQGKKVNDFSLTSPSYLDFRKCLFQFAKPSDAILFEMSSHALEQQRFYHITLDAAGWTSFSQDHLDYHKNMHSYFEAKKKILTHLGSHANLFYPPSQTQWASGLQDPRVQRANDLDKAGLSGQFAVSFARDNLSVAAAMLGSVYKDKNFDFTSLGPVPGRFMVQEKQGRMLIVDYAHTPDALNSLLSNVKGQFRNSKLVVVFGCGGDRDPTKRPLMGSAVSLYADKIYVTSDNPRTEKAEKIIEDILPGLSKPYECIIEREECLLKALSALKLGDVLVVAGKGHEDYIIKGAVKYPYSDLGVIEQFKGWST